MILFAGPAVASAVGLTLVKAIKGRIWRWHSLARVAPIGWYDLEKVNLCRMLQEDLLASFDSPRGEIRPGAALQREQQLQSELAHSQVSLFCRHRLFASLVLPSLSRVSFRAAYAQTGVNLALLACALERYRLARGEFPAQLDQLVPNFLDRLPADLINGQPLKYHRAQNGAFGLYSVGWNETDDGGVLGLSTSEGNVDPKTGDWVWCGP